MKKQLYVLVALLVAASTAGLKSSSSCSWRLTGRVCRWYKY